MTAPSRALAERLTCAVELIGESDSVYVRDLIDVAEDAAAALLREPEPSEAVACELACAWFCTSSPTIPEMGYAGDLVRAVRAAEQRAKEGR